MTESKILIGDNRALLPTLAAGSVHCCVTSPPYWGLRNYNGGDAEVGKEKVMDCLGWATGAKCGVCFICHMAAVMGGREANDGVWRVLRDDGVAWVNIGDSYANDTKWGGKTTGKHAKGLHGGAEIGRGRTSTGLESKNLCMVPARLALALQAAGWYVRCDVIWSKGNPMPESVTDRPAKSHEYVWMLTKSERYYYDHVAVLEPGVTGAWDAMPPIGGRARAELGVNPTQVGNRPASGGMRNRRSVWNVNTSPCPDAHFAVFPPALVLPCLRAGTSERGCCPQCGAGWRRKTIVTVSTSKSCPKTTAAHQARGGTGIPVGTVGKSGGGRIDGSIETIGWEPSCGCEASGEHFLPDDFEAVATPTGSRAGDDPTKQTGRAGMNRPRGESEGVRPITRYEQRKYAVQIKASPNKQAMAAEAGEAFAHYVRTDNRGARPVPEFLLSAWIERGWLERVVTPVRTPPEPVPCTVLDPFCGAGTTGLVARREGRAFVGIELNPCYAQIAERRIAAETFALPGLESLDPAECVNPETDAAPASYENLPFAW